MATAFEDVLNAVYSALLVAPAIADDVLLLRERPTTLERGSEILINMPRASGERFTISGAPVNWTMPLAITLRARGSGGATPLTTMGTLFAATWARLEAITWPAGVMGTLDADFTLDPAEGGDLVAELQLALVVTFRTQAGTLTLAA